MNAEDSPRSIKLVSGAALVCCRCSYSLTGLLETGDCPECGTSVEESRRNANLPREFLGRVGKGLILVIIGHGGLVLERLMTIGFHYVLPGSLLVTRALETIANVSFVVTQFGFWVWASSRPPSAGGDCRGARRVIIASSFAVATCIFARLIATFIAPGLWTSVMPVLGATALVALCAQFLGAMQAALWLGRRTQNKALAAAISRLRWVVPLVTIVGEAGWMTFFAMQNRPPEFLIVAISGMPTLALYTLAIWLVLKAVRPHWPG